MGEFATPRANYPIPRDPYNNILGQASKYVYRLHNQLLIYEK